jgi:hypothetical protein
MSNWINRDIDAEIAKRSKHDEMLIALDGCRKEIIAGSVLTPLTAEDRAWNEANKRAVRIIESYIQRKGLFQ